MPFQDLRHLKKPHTQMVEMRLMILAMLICLALAQKCYTDIYNFFPIKKGYTEFS